MNYLEEQTDGEAMINSIKNGDQPLPRVTQVSIAGTTSTEQSPLKDKSMWSDQEKIIQKVDRLARSLLIQGLPNDIYSLINSNKTVKELWDAFGRHMLGSEYGEQDRKAVVLYEYETFKATEEELLLDTYIRYLQVINDLKKCGYSKDNYVNDAMGSKKKIVVVTFDPLALIAEKANVSRSKEKVVVSLDYEGSEADYFSFQDTKKAGEEGTHTYVLFLVLSDGSTSSQNNNKDALVKGNEHDDDIQKSVSPDIHSSSNELEECTNNSSNRVNAASSLVSTAGHNFINSTNDFSAAGPSNAASSPTAANSSDMPNLEDLTHS
nr:hypothetical protein [Tanacetum cinerariifolium]